MAIRARSDNLSLDIPGSPVAAATPDDAASVRDFAEVWAQREALRQACLRMIGDPARAEDLVQDTFVSALKCSGRLREDQSVAPWLKTVARRRSIDELRVRDRIALMAAVPEPAGGMLDDPAEHVVSQELVESLRRAIAELSPRERQLLLRQASYGMSLAELAAEEETSVASVRSVLARARQKLRSSLERGGVFGGVLPLPRFLSSLRERAVRWSVQLEPTLPAVTGVGVRFGEVVAAVVTAIALMLSGGGLPGYPTESLITVDLASNDGGLALPAVSPRTDRGDGGPPRAGADPNSSAVPPSTPPLAPLPPGIDPPDFPGDGMHAPEQTRFDSVAASADGLTIFGGALSGSTGTPILFRSTDGGQTWSRLGDDELTSAQQYRTFPGGKLMVAPDYPTDPRVFAHWSGTLYRSDDGGVSFRPVAPARGVAHLSPTFAAGDESVYISGPPLLAYRTSSEELEPISTSVQTAGSGLSFDVDFASTGELLLGGTALTSTSQTGAVYTCSPAGCAKRALLSGIANGTQLFVSTTAPGNVFGWTQDRLFHSTDGGHTFSEQSLPTGFLLWGVIEDDDRIYMHGFNESGSAASLYASDDGGATWSAVGVGTGIARGVPSIVALPGGRLLAATSGRGLYCSVDGGATWTARCPAP